MLSAAWRGLGVVAMRDVTRANYVRGFPCVIAQSCMQIDNDLIIILEKAKLYFAEAEVRIYSSNNNSILLSGREPNGQC